MSGPDPTLDSAAARTWTVRAAVASDVEALAALASRAFVDTYLHGHEPHDIHAYVAEHFTPAAFARALDDADGRTMVAIDAAGEIGGYLQLERRPPPACVPGERPVLLSRLYVDRPHHGAGVGPLLWDAALSTARALGGDVLWLTIWEHNLRARRFYERRGMREVGTVEFRVTTRVDRDPVLVVGLAGTAGR